MILAMDDLPNLNLNRQRVLREYKYLNRSGCPRRECLYASEIFLYININIDTVKYGISKYCNDQRSRKF